MKLLKGRSLRKSKKKLSSAASVDASDAAGGLVESASQLDSPTSAAATPPTDGDESDSTPPAHAPPGSPGRNSTSSAKRANPSSLRPLRLGSFNFTDPTINAAVATGQSTPPSLLSGPTFPLLFHEADDMLNLSNLIYTLAELRDLARNGVLANPAQSGRILELPLPLDMALKIIGVEGECLRQVLDDGMHETTLSALKSLLDRQRERVSVAGQVGDGDKNGGDNIADTSQQQHQEMSSSVLTAMGDLKSNEELVYAVGINPAEERITVVFRGSVTKNDFLTDATIALVGAPDPRKFNGTESEDSTGGDVGVHQGFREYLFGEPGDGRGSKYAEIMTHVGDLLAENPARRRYRLYVTGHSLGGALATLFGFYAAASPALTLPVTIVSVASPRVGNIAFARTFAELESQGKVRHLRIANHKDPVTLGPTVSSKRALALSAKAFSPLVYLALTLSGNGEGGEEEVYYHTGMKMKLFKNVSAVGSQRYELSYSGATIVSGAEKPVAIDKDDLAEIELSNERKRKESSTELPMVSYHYGTSYSERLAAAESDLKGLTLNDLYRDKACGMPCVA